MAQVYEIGRLVSDVRIALDENDVQNELLLNDAYTLQLDDIIKSKIGDAVDGVMASAPLELLGEGVEVANATLDWDGGESDDEDLRMCRFAKPNDFLRLVGIKMPDWDYPVSELIDMHSDDYKMQKSRYSGMRGNPQRPVVAQVAGKGGYYFELYTSRKRELDFARYIQRMSGADFSDTIELPHSALYRVVVYQIAGLVCVTLKEAEHAQTLFGIAEGLLASQEDRKDSSVVNG